MNNRPRYKRRRRKKQAKTIIIISLCVILVLFVIFMVTGLILAEKASDNDPNSNDIQTEEDSNQPSQTLKSINAYPLALLEDGSTFVSRISNLPDEARAVCVSLNTPKGMLLFRSTISSHFPTLEAKGDASQLSKSTNTLKNDELYSTALLYMENFFESNSELINNVYSSIWGAIACEAIEDGINDVLLIPSDAYSDAEKLCALANQIHLTNEDATIGLAIPDEILNDDDSENLINVLAGAFDYLAIDATNVITDDEKSAAEQIDSFVGKYWVQIKYHNMRVILPKGVNAEEQNSFIEAITSYNIKNWQISPN